MVFLVFAFYKGLIDFDYNDFRILLKLFTSPGLHTATLPASWKWSKENFENIASDFSSFFVNVLCKTTSKDICVKIYLDLLYKIYKNENCCEVYEDTFEKTCRMVDRYYAKEYFKILDFKILDKLDGFEKCSGAEFCHVLLTVRHTCTICIFEYLKTPGQYSLITFMLLVCLCLIVMIVSCCKIKKQPIFVFKHFCLFILIFLFFVGYTYTRFLRRKFVGFYVDAPVEIHTRNAIFIIVAITHISLACASVGICSLLKHKSFL